MSRVLVIESRGAVAETIVRHLWASPAVEFVHILTSRKDRSIRSSTHTDFSTCLSDGRFDTLVFSPSACRGKAWVPDLTAAEEMLHSLADCGLRKVVVLSSAAVYGPNPHNPGLFSEERLALRNRKNKIAARWLELEELAHKYLGPHPEVMLTILRPAALPLPGDLNILGGLLRRRVVLTVLGHDPSIQLLSMEDLARAVRAAVERGREGLYNVAPAGVIPLRKALRLVGVKSLPVPYVVQRLARTLLAPLGLASPADLVDYLRYNWTVSGARIKGEVGFEPHASSAMVLVEVVRANGREPEHCSGIDGRRYDAFGLDEDYLAASGRGLAGFFQRVYWRLEARGLEQVPRQGGAILVGIHRGFMPWDGVMAVHLVAQATGRVPRFLIHPALVKFPFLHDYMFKLGGVIACNENAEYILRRNELLAVFPEGIHGAFSLYRDAYRPGKFWRNDYVRMALRHGVPIVPFVTLGSAEIFPILGKIEWGWWKRYAEWPFIPLTPTFPLLPVPLPSKWHTLFLPPVHFGRQFGPEAAADDEVVAGIGAKVRGVMEETLAGMLKRRRSIFYGSIFEEDPAARTVAMDTEMT
jgi:nucleoside-diphosphate-sugar epimerase/1-acyl-sn-glycerol-3-phosphate acyltransferase